ncbi:MAG TPA: PDZ domain-containing protein [Gemmatirosa sp.]|nr:PDZ domain-containing protein [Gemmatirosa sp.]
MTAVLVAGAIAPLAAQPARDAAPAPLRRRAFLGAQLSPVPDSLRAGLAGLAPQGGALVRRVDPGTAAAAAGLRPGDVIVRADSAPVPAVPALTALLARRHAGAPMTLALVRDGRRVAVRLTLGTLPEERAPGIAFTYTAVLADGARRRMIVTRPEGAAAERRPAERRPAERRPAVLLVGGIGCYPVDTPVGEPGAYQRVLYHLTRRGFVTVRVEKSGIGDSEGTACPDADLRTEVAGYVAALRATRALPDVDSARVVILGHSIGGIVAPLVAAQVPVRGIVAMSTVGTSWFEYELDNTRRQVGMAGAAPDSLDAALRVKERCMHASLVEGVAPVAQVARDAACAPFLQYPAAHAYVAQLAALNLGEVWRRADADVLAVYPTSDFLTSAREHEALVAKANYYRPGRASLTLVEGMDHYFAPAATPLDSYRSETSPLARPFFAGILPVLDAWLDRTVGRPPAASAASTRAR